MEQAFIDYIVKSLVDEPDKVSLTAIEGEKSTILELRVAQSDIGKVIGKHGRIIRAIRTLLSTISPYADRRVVLEILD